MTDLETEFVEYSDESVISLLCLAQCTKSDEVIYIICDFVTSRGHNEPDCIA